MLSDDDNDQTFPPLVFSKAGINNPVGKLDFEIKTKVDGDTFLEFTKLVNGSGTDRAGAVRDWIFLKVHGKTFTDMVRDAEKVNRDKLFGTGPDEGILTPKVAS